MNKDSKKTKNQKNEDNSDFAKEAREKKAEAEDKDESEFDFIKDMENQILNGIKRLSEINLKKLDAGVLFAGIDQLHKSITVIDKRVSSYAKDLSSKGEDFIKASIKNHKKKHNS